MTRTYKILRRALVNAILKELYKYHSLKNTFSI